MREALPISLLFRQNKISVRRFFAIFLHRFKMMLGFVFLVFTAVSCTSDRETRIILPDGIIEKINWTDAEKRLDLAKRTLWETAEASGHAIRLAQNEKPHVHDDHDLHVLVWRGRARIHFQNKTVDLRPGDFIEVPKGNVHWAENVSKEASEVYAIFTPAMKTKDERLVS